MKKAGDSLPPHGIELTWVSGQRLVPKTLAKVSTPIPVGYNIGFKETCVGRIVSGSETNGMAVSYLPQLLDCVPSCEARQPPIRQKSVLKTHLSLFEHSLVPFYPSSKMSPLRAVHIV